jgi:tRNA(adenine34) deaminase
VPDDEAMRVALDEAAAALAHDDVPVGAVVVRDGVIIAARHNERELTGDPSAHAEMLAIRDAAVATGSWRLDGCTLYVTLEPCAMCAGAIVNARVPRVVFATPDPKAGFGGSLGDLLADARLNHRAAVTSGVLAAECGEILRAFFRARRGSALAADAVDEPAQGAAALGRDRRGDGVAGE